MAERIYKTITIPQLVEVLAEVNRNHTYVLLGRKIKYVDWHFDNRSASVFTIRFRAVGLETEKTFTSTNRCKNGEMEDVDLFIEVMDWLISGRTVKCQECDGTGAVDSGGSDPQGKFINVPCPYCDARGVRAIDEREHYEAMRQLVYSELDQPATPASDASK